MWSLIYEAGHAKPVLRDLLVVLGGEGGGTGVQDGGDTCILWPIQTDVRQKHHSFAKRLSSN